MIPLVPFPLKKALKISKKFRPLAKHFLKFSPGLKRDLFQSKMGMDEREYMSLVVFTSFFYSILLGVLVSFIEFYIKNTLLIGPLMFIAFFFIPFYFLIFIPKIKAKKRVRKLEKDLLFGLRHILIEVRSGIPLYNAIVGATSGYGELSEEFKRVVREVEGGGKEIDALNEAAKRTPSLYFRRALWQLVNAIKAGSDLGDTLEAITNDFAKKQSNEIQTYGQQLNPWAMLYMIVAVIIPSLGITFLIILSSFSGLGLPDFLFPAILLGLGLFQFFFMNFIKTKRPAISV